MKITFNESNIGGKILSNIQVALNAVFPTNIDAPHSTEPTNIVLVAILGKYRAINPVMLGEWDSISQAYEKISSIALAKAYDGVESIVASTGSFSSLPLFDFEEIIRSGESTNKTMGEDVPYSGSADFENFTIDSPSAKAISRNEADGKDQHKITNIEVYLKRQEFYEKYRPIAEYAENIVKSLIEGYVTAY